MLEAFRRHLAASGLIPDGSRVLVGYSGGADSTCLLHLLKLAGIDVVAGHLHHGQRKEADKEMSLCESFCDELDIPFASGNADVPGMASDLHIGLEEAGRNARYAFFSQAAFRLSCDLIATAHTRSDQAETVIFNLTRGTGLAGLAGIPARRENIIRPLLPFSRTETRAYCDEHSLWYHDDPSNEDINFSRARIRLRILPELRAINPAADESLERIARIAAEEESFLNGMAASALEKAEIPLNGDLGFLTDNCEIAFDRQVMGGLPRVLFKRAVRLTTAFLGAGLNFEQTEMLADGIAGTERGSITADGGEIVVEWDPARVHARQVQPVTPYRHALTVPGETISEEFGWVIAAFESAPSGTEPSRTAMQIEIDTEKTAGSLYFRTAKDGDRMQPIGFEGHRKLSDLLSESGLTPAARARIPIVCDLVGPIWIPGVCLDERVRVGPESQRAIVLRFGAESRS